MQLVLLPLLCLQLLSVLPSVAAHGFVHIVWDNTKTYVGNIPQAEPTPSIVRQIDTVDPVKGANNTFLNCGQDAQLAESVATVNPGDEMRFLWQGGDLSTWPHNIGPLMWYMTECPGNCTSYNSSTAEWFKISQLGRIPNDPNGDWYQNNIYIQANVTTNVTLPSNIAPGNYLVRHEIIALHLATSLGGAEFYPSCTQIRVAGSGTGKPTQEELVTFPGAYSDTDPGILVPDVFDLPPPPYTFPGPPVAAFVTQGAGATGTGTAARAGPTTTATSPGGGAGAGKTCKLVRASPSASASSSTKRELEELAPVPVARPRPRAHSVSGIMRDLAVGLRAIGSRH
ncbi:hypothetical protein HMN09_00841400 [Mycena chlorophos]|uniref:lytic cellulose monooxygenase (C4-dehydrogenating) n=1 Tax=Mycena chlorophos TaxID=658473 RepID=A0A8H6SR96_MYCCL|nr:hypothetical protein HMN09_00841400 [Mycena chlorophos]